ncbi:MAG: hypothetical protein ACLRPZ_03885 [Coprococcus sp.]
MQTVKFVTKENEKIIVWCTTNTLTGFRKFLQYILDNINTPEDFYIIDLKSDLVYNAYRIATEVYKMRKRTFEERMEDMQTGKWFGVDVKELEKSFNMKR